MDVFCGWCGEEGDPETDPGHAECAAALQPGEVKRVTKLRCQGELLELMP